MNYELRVEEDYSKEWLTADITDTVIALTYQANDVAELKNRQANHSNNIKLPRTTTNDAIFGFSGEIRSAYNSAFRRLPCILTIDGIAVSGEGSFLQLTAVSNNFYECTIYGGTFDFFSAIKNKPLRSLMATNIPEFTIPDVKKWDIYGVKESYPDEGRSFKGAYENSPFAIMDWHKEEVPLAHIKDGNPSIGEPPTINVGSLYPCVRLQALLANICENVEYTFETDVSNDSRFINAAIPCVSALPSHTPKEEWKGDYTQREESVKLIPNKEGYNFSNSGVNSNNVFTKGGQSLQFTAPTKGKYTFKISFGTQGGTNRLVRLQVINDATVVLNVTCQDSFDRQMQFDIEKNKPISFSLINSSLGGVYCSVTNLKIECVNLLESFEEDIQLEKMFPVIRNLPDVSQLDIFKLFVQLFGMTVHVDNKQRKVYCYTFNKVYENRTIARNWSSKLDSRTTDMEFHMDYGQVNILKYKDYESVALRGDKETEILTQSVGKFEVDDKTLDPEKELFELNAVACDEVPHFDLGYTAKIRLRKDNVRSGTGPFTIVHLRKEKTDRGFHLTEGTVNTKSKGIIELVLAEFWPFDAQTMLNVYYDKLTTQMLRNSRMLTVYMLLAPLDVADFDHSIPIYLQKYNAYFYVNKIHNYRSDKLVKVDLVKL